MTVGMKKQLVAVSGVAVLLLAVAACASNRDDNGGSSSTSGGSFILGTTDTITAVDPAGSYALGDSTLQYSLFQTLVTIPAGQTTPVGDAAESCDYDDPSTLTCKLKPDLKFSNGDALTSSDVKYSFERALTIGDPNGAAIYLLGDIAATDPKGNVTGLRDGAIETPDDTTVIFHLSRPDVTFVSLITYPGAGAIVDEDVFPADKKLADDAVIGSGPYTLAAYEAGNQATLQKNDNYSGDAAKTDQVFIKYYTDSSSLKQAVANGEVNIAWDALGPTDIEALKSESSVTVAEGPGAAIRYWVWRTDSGPGKELAVRQAAAQIIDRAAIAKTAYADTVTPLYSTVPPGLDGNEAFKDAYGAGPDVAGAKKTLEDAGVQTPVEITMGWTPTHYGPNTVDEATEFKRELEDSGLFKVKLSSTEWEQYQTIYKEGAYDLWILGWYPDYPDPDDYLSVFLVDGGFFQNGYQNDEVNSLVNHELGSTDPAARAEDFTKLQDIAARDVPIIPSWVGNNVAAYGDGVDGATVKATLDTAYIFRLWTITTT
ncbi:MAG TPA: ABC transporter substrate-binding protein [Nocardioidaceae bacterium]|nr:ABC transporter substrate-binding protein [Nocardioidaceae bacterium]